MKSLLEPWHLLLLILAGWINHRQHYAIEYLRTENQVLKEKLGKKRILLDDNQRRRLAVKGKILGRNMLQEVATIVTSERNHQGLDNRLIEPSDEVGHRRGEIRCRERLGGMLRYYYRKAA